jgi:hypothetical protein
VHAAAQPKRFGPRISTPFGPTLTVYPVIYSKFIRILQTPATLYEVTTVPDAVFLAAVSSSPNPEDREKWRRLTTANGSFSLLRHFEISYPKVREAQ